MPPPQKKKTLGLPWTSGWWRALVSLALAQSACMSGGILASHSPLGAAPVCLQSRQPPPPCVTGHSPHLQAWAPHLGTEGQVLPVLSLGQVRLHKDYETSRRGRGGR